MPLLWLVMELSKMKNIGKLETHGVNIGVNQDTLELEETMKLENKEPMS